MAASIVLLESGSDLLLEDNASKLLLETGAGSAAIGFHILLESGDSTLLEDGTFLLLETAVAATTTQTVGGVGEVSKETRAYWESEGRRLAVLRDDDEILVVM